MTVVLHSTRSLPRDHDCGRWFVTTGTAVPAGFDSARKLPQLAVRLEDAFDRMRDTWWSLCRELGRTPSAALAQAPTGAFGSDFGVMLAWSRLVSELARDKRAEPVLCLCDDPWLFRHLAGIPGVVAGPAPPLWRAALRLAVRGVAARAAVALRTSAWSLLLRGQRRANPSGCRTILVYGHPASDAAGKDAYFGALMRWCPALRRTLHTDCPPLRARQLAADGRSASLHGWGSPGYAMCALPFARWRPSRAERRGPWGWLVRRAAARENGGGAPAMNLWQHHCQTRWLTAVRPRIVAWPWENHGWERALCRAARERQVVTAGYQHTVVGPHQINYSPRSNSDGTASLPDHVICDGPAYRAELIGWDVPPERTVDGGALRFSHFEADLYDPDGPVFVPLSGTTEAAEAQLAAARLLSERGRHILVKSHPLYPKPVVENDRIRRTEKPLPEQGKLSAVLYSNGTSGLEGLLAGLPTFRLLLEDRVAVDVLPAFVKVTAVTLDTVVDAVERAERPARLDWRSVLSPPDRALWTRLLGADERLASCEALPYMAQDSIRE